MIRHSRMTNEATEFMPGHKKHKLPTLITIITTLLLVQVCFSTSALSWFEGRLDTSRYQEPKQGSFVAQRPTESDFQYHHSGAPGAPQPRNLRLLYEAVSLIRKHHVEPFHANQAMRRALGKLSMVLPPFCSESPEPFDECHGKPVDCFGIAIANYAHDCQLDPDRLLWTALEFLVGELDHNSSLLDRTMLKEITISTSGRFGGVGMVVARRGEDYVVISSIEGSPADRAGIKAGDVVMEIDGKPIHGQPLPRILAEVRGSVGSKIRITVRSEGQEETHTYRLTRKLIRIAPVKYRVLQGKVGYLKIVNFQKRTAREVKRALEKMSRSVRGGVKGLILDLRDNPGGLFDQAIEVADLFISSDVITSVRGRYRRLNRDFEARKRGTFPEVPMVVLINKSSASAAEILAGALQSRPDVLVMGRRSFGKASVQGIFPLRKGCGLRLTTARYFTPKGRDIDGTGIVPDIVIENDRNKGGIRDKKLLARDGPENDDWVTGALEYIPALHAERRSPFSNWH
jgi:carboxyl-terminal processing protease